MLKQILTYDHLYCIFCYLPYRNHLHRKWNRKDKRNIERNTDKITVAEHSDKKIIIFYCVHGWKGKTCIINTKNGGYMFFVLLSAQFSCFITQNMDTKLFIIFKNIITIYFRMFHRLEYLMMTNDNKTIQLLCVIYFYQWKRW